LIKIEIEEFDNHLDQQKLKKAVQPSRKRRKKTVEISFLKKPLSQDPKYNS